MKLYEKAVALIKERHRCKTARNWDGFAVNNQLLRDLAGTGHCISRPGFYISNPRFSLALKPEVSVLLMFTLLHADLTGAFGGWSDITVVLNPNEMRVSGLVEEYAHQLGDLKHVVTEFLNQEVK